MGGRGMHHLWGVKRKSQIVSYTNKEELLKIEMINLECKILALSVDS
jgi:hypothetical protein